MLNRASYATGSASVKIEGLPYDIVGFRNPQCAKEFYEMIVAALMENKPVLNLDITQMQKVPYSQGI